MRINLLLNNKENIRQGYLNIDPFADEKDDRVKGDCINLDKYVCDGEAEEIVAYNILEYYPSESISQIMPNWLKKLSHKGIVVIACTDIDLIAKAIIEDKLERKILDKLIYGNQRFDWEFKKCALSCEKLSVWLEMKGYKIIHKRFNKFDFILTAQRL